MLCNDCGIYYTNFIVLIYAYKPVSVETVETSMYFDLLKTRVFDRILLPDFCCSGFGISSIFYIFMQLSIIIVVGYGIGFRIAQNQSNSVDNM